jgi:hypothetical protein
MPSRAGLRLRARPVMPCRLFTGADEPHAAHRLLQSNGPTSTPCEHPNPPGCACEATPEWQLDPWQGRASRAASNQGSPDDGSPYRLPRGDRSPYGFTQFRFDSDTPCRDADTAADWMVDDSDLRWRSLLRRISSPWHARPRPGHDRGRVPLGPPSIGPRERNDGQPHPRCLPPIPSSLRCARGAVVARGGG